mmetsp:Transcript_81215/g.263268  ORF Transcript_81215/g.263268 Transcript_81215/m.263268 type:complete len:358 (-) Transcript_81215:187-1260(-)
MVHRRPAPCASGPRGGADEEEEEAPSWAGYTHRAGSASNHIWKLSHAEPLSSVLICQQPRSPSHSISRGASPLLVPRYQHDCGGTAGLDPRPSSAWEDNLFKLLALISLSFDDAEASPSSRTCHVPSTWPMSVPSCPFSSVCEDKPQILTRSPSASTFSSPPPAATAPDATAAAPAAVSSAGAGSSPGTTAGKKRAALRALERCGGSASAKTRPSSRSCSPAEGSTAGAVAEDPMLSPPLASRSTSASPPQAPCWEEGSLCLNSRASARRMLEGASSLVTAGCSGTTSARGCRYLAGESGGARNRILPAYGIFQPSSQMEVSSSGVMPASATNIRTAPPPPSRPAAAVTLPAPWAAS